MPDPAPTERRPKTPLHGKGDGEPPANSPRSAFRPRFLLLVVALLAINWLLMSLVPPPGGKPIDVPYSPFFLEQVEAGNVERIAASGTTIDGEFRNEVAYDGSDEAKRFNTEVPVFADHEKLSAAL